MITSSSSLSINGQTHINLMIISSPHLIHTAYLLLLTSCRHPHGLAYYQFSNLYSPTAGLCLLQSHVSVPYVNIDVITALISSTSTDFANLLSFPVQSTPSTYLNFTSASTVPPLRRLLPPLNSELNYVILSPCLNSLFFRSTIILSLPSQPHTLTSEFPALTFKARLSVLPPPPSPTPLP